MFTFSLRQWMVSLLLFLSSACLIASAEENKINERDERDLITLMLLRDVQDHVLYIRLLENKELELRELLLNNLAMKLFDLNHYLAEAENASTTKLVCKASNNLREDLKKIAAGCKDTTSNQVCEETYHWSRICVAKGIK